MNMETAMKASVTGWKQQVTADHGKGRAAGKANFADTFSEMLKTGKKAAEDRTQSQSARKTPEIQTGSKTDDTGNDTVRAEASDRQIPGLRRLRKRSRIRKRRKILHRKKREKRQIWKSWQSRQQLWRKLRPCR